MWTPTALKPVCSGSFTRLLRLKSEQWVGRGSWGSVTVHSCACSLPVVTGAPQRGRLPPHTARVRTEAPSSGNGCCHITSDAGASPGLAPRSGRGGPPPAHGGWGVGAAQGAGCRRQPRFSDLCVHLRLILSLSDTERRVWEQGSGALPAPAPSQLPCAAQRSGRVTARLPGTLLAGAPALHRRDAGRVAARRLLARGGWLRSGLGLGP